MTMNTSNPEHDIRWQFRIFFWSIFVLLLLILLSLHFFMALAYEQTIEILTRVQAMESTVEKLKIRLGPDEAAKEAAKSAAVKK